MTDHRPDEHEAEPEIWEGSREQLHKAMDFLEVVTGTGRVWFKPTYIPDAPPEKQFRVRRSTPDEVEVMTAATKQRTFLDKKDGWSLCHAALDSIEFKSGFIDGHDVERVLNDFIPKALPVLNMTPYQVAEIRIELFYE